MNIRTLLERIGVLDPKPTGLADLARASTDSTGHVSRRAFLGFAGAGLAALSVDPEQLLWSPGERTILVPDTFKIATLEEIADFGGGGRLNQFVTPGWVSKEVLRHMQKNLQFLSNVNRSYDDRFALRGGAKVGDSVTVRVPQPFTVRKDDALLPQRLADLTREVPLDKQYCIEVDPSRMCSDQRKGLPMETISDRHVRPIAEKLALEMNRAGINITADLQLPMDAPRASICRCEKLGVSLRAVERYDAVDHRNLIRVDVLGGKA